MLTPLRRLVIEPLRSGVPRSALLMKALGGGVAAAVVLWSLSWLLLSPLDVSGMLLAMVLIASAVLGYVVGIIVYRSRLGLLHEGILNAQEGMLKPVHKPPGGDPFLTVLYRDFNDAVNTLGGMFTLVEECQKRMLAERDRMNVIVQSLPAALIGVDNDLCINLVNRRAEELFGVPKDHLVGHDLFSILGVRDSDRDVLRDAFLYKYDIRNRVFHLETRRGETWLSTNLSFLTKREGDMTAVMTLLDITDYKQLQETVYNREKLVAMGQLAAGVAHELNTPLGTILGRAQILQSLEGSSSRVVEGAKIIADEARRCSSVIQNLLNYARKAQCEEGSCDVNTLIEEIAETFINCRLKRQGISVELDLASERMLAAIACGELDIVLTNLILNSIQALEDVEDPKIKIRTWRINKFSICLSVEDNGPGIPPEARTRIFEPFFTTKEVGEGSGLGLSISQALLAKRGASIRYDQGHRNGARFLLTLPVAPDRGESKA